MHMLDRYSVLVAFILGLGLISQPAVPQSGGGDGSCDWMKTNIQDQRTAAGKSAKQDVERFFADGSDGGPGGGSASTVAFGGPSPRKNSSASVNTVAKDVTPTPSVRESIQSTYGTVQSSARTANYRPGSANVIQTQSGSESGNNQSMWDQAQEQCLGFQDIKIGTSLTGIAMDQLMNQLKKMAKKACEKANSMTSNLQDQAMQAATLSVDAPYGMGGSIGPKRADEGETGFFQDPMGRLEKDLPQPKLTTDPTEVISDTQWEKVDYKSVDPNLSGSVGSKAESVMDDMTSGTQEQLEEYNEQTDVETDYTDESMSDVMDEAVNNE